MFTKDGITYESEDEYLNNSSENQKILRDRKKAKNRRIILIIIVLLIIAFFVGIAKYARSLLYEKKKSFDEYDTAKIEELFDISFDNVKLDEFNRQTAAGDSFYQLYLSGIEDYNSFLENNFNCEYKSIGKNGTFASDSLKKGFGEYSEAFSFFPDNVNDDLSEFKIYFYPANDGAYNALIHGYMY